MGDDRSKGSSAIGDGGQAAMSLMADIDCLSLGFLLELDTRLHLERFVCRGLLYLG